MGDLLGSPRVESLFFCELYFSEAETMEFDQNDSESCSNARLRLQFTGESRNSGPRAKFTILPFRRSPCQISPITLPKPSQREDREMLSRIHIL